MYLYKRKKGYKNQRKYGENQGKTFRNFDFLKLLNICRNSIRYIAHKVSAYDSIEEDSSPRLDHKTKANDEAVKLEVVDNIYYETIDNDQQNNGINKEGLVTNRTHLGETEVVKITENIYYETLNNV